MNEMPKKRAASEGYTVELLLTVINACSCEEFCWFQRDYFCELCNVAQN